MNHRLDASVSDVWRDAESLQYRPWSSMIGLAPEAQAFGHSCFC